jgi:hypothetical protein
MNRALAVNYIGTNAGTNWIALPYNNPYTKAKDLCIAIGVAAAGAVVSQNLNPTLGTISNFTCNNIAGHPTNFTINPRFGVRFTNTAATPSSVILVGSSNETFQLTTLGLYVSPSLARQNWFSVPYHTTWVKAADVCSWIGPTPPAGSVQVTISRLAGANFQNFTCNTNPALPTNFSLVMGEAIRITKVNPQPDSPALFPPHF